MRPLVKAHRALPGLARVAPGLLASKQLREAMRRIAAHGHAVVELAAAARPAVVAIEAHPRPHTLRPRTRHPRPGSTPSPSSPTRPRSHGRWRTECPLRSDGGSRLGLRGRSGVLRRDFRWHIRCTCLKCIEPARNRAPRGCLRPKLGRAVLPGQIGPPGRRRAWTRTSNASDASRVVQVHGTGVDHRLRGGDPGAPKELPLGAASPRPGRGSATRGVGAERQRR
jgi:hypothetical protein